MSGFTLVPQITVHPGKICYFNEVCWEGTRKSSLNPETGEKVHGIKYDHLLNSKRTAEGKVSDIARRKMSKALDYLLIMANNNKLQITQSGRHFHFKIAFITLTLPSKQIHSDKKIKSDCLNQFIIELKKYHHVRNYIWRAEKQKNGNIHFHLVCDKFVPWSDIRDRWNRITNKLGYVDRYRDNMRQFYSDGFRLRRDLLDQWPEKKQYKAYQKNVTTDWNSPNSTDIHSVRNIINIKDYIAKYMTKEEGVDPLSGEITKDNLKLGGRIWGSNQAISNPTGARLVLDYETEKELQQVIKTGNCRVYHADYFSVVHVSFSVLNGLGAPGIFKAFCSYLVDNFGFNYQTSVPF